MSDRTSGTTRRRHALVDSPLGLLTVVASDDALTGLFQTQQRHLPDPAVFGDRDDSVLPAVREQLDAYFRRELTTFDLPLDPQGTPFQRSVWQALCAIPYGQTRSYGELAAQLGRPAATRAVGAANGRNPICIVVPCHRVVGSRGLLVGYGGGLERKQLLLDLERRDTLPLGEPAGPP